MLKKELADRLQKKFPDYLKEDIREVVDIVFEKMAASLEKGRRIEIRGFGSFALHDQKEKLFTNPKTGKTITCPANKRIVFRAGSDLRNLPVATPHGDPEPAAGETVNNKADNPEEPMEKTAETDSEPVTVRQLTLF
jgi:integration host factor subunit beta